MLVEQPDKPIGVFRRASASEPFALVVVFLMMISGFSTWMLFSRAPKVEATLDTPMLITYQGKLTDANRITVPDSALNMKFAIYTSASGASGCVWAAGDDSGDGADTVFSQSSDCPSHVPSTAVSVTPSEGVVTVILGASPQNAIPDALFDDNSALYLGVTVGADAEMTPRIRLTATPYAFQAGDADLLDGLDSTAFLTSSTAFVQGGNSFAAAGVIGTNDAYALSFETNGTTQMSLGTSGHLTPAANDTQNLGSDSLRWADLYLGPGTLHVGTVATDEGIISYDTTGNVFDFGTDSTTNGDIAFFTDDLYIDKSASSVGIGDTTPDFLLDVAGTFGTDGNVTLGDASGDTVTSNAAAWTFANATTVALASSTSALNIDANTLVIDSTNNRVGIGTATPGQALAVTGSADVTGHSAIGANASVDDGTLMWPSNTFSNVLTVAETSTNVSVDFVEGITSYLNYNPSASAATVYAFAMDGEVASDAGNSQNIATLTGGYFSADHNGTGTVNEINGIEVSSERWAGTVTNAYGVNAYAFDGVNTYGVSALGWKQDVTAAGNNYGGHFDGYSSNAVTTGTDNTYGVFSSITRTGATGGTINSYGYYLDVAALDAAGAGTSSAYGLYLENVTGADTNYALYSAGGQSYFAGNVGIADATPDFALDVAGTLGTDGNATIGDAVTDRLTVTGELLLGSISADPTGTNGLTYYNTTSNKFRCYENGAWANCIGAGGGGVDNFDEVYAESIADGNLTMEIDNAGGLNFDAISGDFVVRDSGSVAFATFTAAGAVSFANGVDLGSSTADTISMNGYLDTGLVPTTDGTLDLGSTSNRWGDLFLDGATLHVGDAADDEFTLAYNAATNLTSLNSDGAAGEIAFLSADTERVRIDGSGNVGIGDATPDAMLDVAGAVRWDGSATMGDASGDALTINASTASIPNNLNIDSNTLFIDSTNNRVTIGSATANVGNPFMVSKSDSGTNIDSVNAWSSVHNSNTTNNTLAIMTFATNDTGGTLAGGARMAAQFTSHAIGGVSADFIFQNRSSGAWIEPFVIRSTGNIELDGTTFRLDAAGNSVGIGDTTPDAMLDVGGTIRWDGAATIGDASGDTVTSNAAAWTFANATTVALASSTAALNFDSNTLVIDSTNNRVGIGTASPEAMLDISKDSGAELAYFQTYSTDAVGGNVRFRKARGTEASPTVAASGDAAPGFVYQAYDGNSFENLATINAFVDGTPGDGDMPGRLTFETSTDGSVVLTERMRITNAGNVGIGDTSPVALFTVGSGDLFTVDTSGNTAIDGTTTLGDASGDTVTSNAAAWTFANATTVALASSTSALNIDANTLVIDSTNNRVGIGTATPGQALAVTGSADVTGHSAIGANASVDDGSLMWPSNTFSNVLTVAETSTNASVDFVEAITSHLNYNPSATAATVSVYAVDGEVTSAAANSQNISSLNGGYFSADHNGSGTVSEMSGVVGTAERWGGTVTDLYGGQFWTYDGVNTYGVNALGWKADITTAGTNYGGYFWGYSANAVTSGTDSTYGVYSRIYRTGATGGTINSYGVYVENETVDNAGAGTANFYGLYLEDITGADTNYALYSAGGQSYFAGNVGIADATPDFALDVAGTLGTDGNATVGDATTDRLTVTGELLLGSVSADPTGANGLTYYNTTSNKFRCYENGAWANCIGAGGGGVDNFDDVYAESITDGNLTMEIDNVGGLNFDAISGDFVVRDSGSVAFATFTAAGNVNFANGVDLGSSTADTISMNGYLDTPLIPTTDGTLDLGSTANRWGDLFLDGATLHVGDAADDEFTLAYNAATNLTSLNSDGAAGEIAFLSADTERVRIDGSGNVGIGDTTPDALLDVAGTFQADGNVTLGDASGDTVTSNAAAWTFANATTVALASSTAALNFDSDTLVIDSANNRVGIGDTTPAAALTVGAGDRFKVNSDGDITSSFTQLDGTDLANGAGAATTTLVLDDTTGFNAGNYVLVNSTYAKIVSVDSGTNLTISPALTWGDNATVDEYHVPEIGGLDLTQALANRYGRGYFIDGIVAGNGTTYITDGRIESAGPLLINATGNQAVTFGTGTVTFNGTLATAAGQNTNFDSGTLFVDASNDRVGIGNAAPDYKLDIAGTMRSGGPGTDGQFRLYSEQGATDYEVVFNPNAAMTQTVTYTLPADDGSASQVLTTDGSGALSWATAGGSGANTSLSNLTTVALNADLLPSAAPSSSSGSPTSTLVDTGSALGQYSSIAVPADGNPVIANYITTDGDLSFVKCGDSSCSSANITTVLDSTGDVGRYTSVAISADGYPVISYYDVTNGNLKVIKCGNANCSSGNTTSALDSTGDVGQYTDVAVPADGYPFISYYDVTNADLKVVKCGNAACSSGNTTTTVDSTGTVGRYTSVAISSDGYPVISYHDVTNGDLKVTKCGNADCSSGNTTTMVDDGAYKGYYTSIYVPADGNPAIAHYDANTGDLRMTKCGNSSCSSGNTNTAIDTTGDVGMYASITVPTDALPAIGYYDLSNGNLKMIKCGNGSCSSGNTTTTVESSGEVGSHTSIAIASNGYPIMSYHATYTFLKVTRCVSANCASSPTISHVDLPAAGSVDVAIPTDGYPVISYQHSGYLMMMRCGNSSCSADNAVTIMDQAGSGAAENSIAISADGYPVIGYRDSGSSTLKVVKCGNAACSSGNSTSTVDASGSVTTGRISIAVPPDGYPVISYMRSSQLYAAKCGNAACSSGNTTTLVSASYSDASLALGSDGLPVISAYYAAGGDLYVIKCGNAACSSGNTTTSLDSTNAVGQYSSIAVPSDGFPIIAYYDQTASTLKAYKCSNATCTSGTPTTADPISGTGDGYISLSVPAGGLPIIFYRQSSRLKVLKCGNTHCTSAASLYALESSGADTYVVSATSSTPADTPLVAYLRDGGSLKVTKCADAACAPSVTTYSGGRNIGSSSAYFNNVYAANYYGKRFFIDGFDVAESYAVNDRTIGAGDIIRASAILSTGQHPLVERSAGAYDGGVIGVVSTKPGIHLSDWSDGDDTRPIALAGRVPVKVNMENGPIAVGDAVTASSVPGIGMRATQPGMVVGYALSAYSGPEQGTVMLFVSPSFHMADSVIQAASGEASADAPGMDSFGLALRGSGWDGETAQAVAMKLVTDVIDAATYALSIRNQADTEVAYITDDGVMSVASDMVVGGKLYPSALGVVQTDFYIAFGGAEDGFMRTNAGWATDFNDFAETFPSSQPLEPGEVVAFEAAGAFVKAADAEDAMRLAGIVSTRPGFLAGAKEANAYPIALAGRVPTNVSVENGPVEVGDALTVSALRPGYAMKATEAGMIVGYALEPAAEDGSVIAFVHLGYWPGMGSQPNAGTSNVASTFSGELTTLTMNGNIYMQGNRILNVGALAGLGNAWSVNEAGDFATEGSYKVVIESYQAEKVEAVVPVALEHKVTLSGTGTLTAGTGTIVFEDESPSFNDITSTTAPVRVLVTLRGAANGIFVESADHNGFVARETMGGVSDGVEFDWFVEAYRKDFEPAVDVPVEVPPAEVPPTEVPPVTDPPPADPVPTDPVPTDPPPTEPAPTDPAPTEPPPAETPPAEAPVEPPPAETPPAEPPAEIIP